MSEKLYSAQARSESKTPSLLTKLTHTHAIQLNSIFSVGSNSIHFATSIHSLRPCCNLHLCVVEANKRASFYYHLRNSSSALHLDGYRANPWIRSNPTMMKLTKTRIPTVSTRRHRLRNRRHGPSSLQPRVMPQLPQHEGGRRETLHSSQAKPRGEPQATRIPYNGVALSPPVEASPFFPRCAVFRSVRTRPPSASRWIPPLPARAAAVSGGSGPAAPPSRPARHCHQPQLKTKEREKNENKKLVQDATLSCSPHGRVFIQVPRMQQARFGGSFVFVRERVLCETTRSETGGSPVLYALYALLRYQLR